MRVIGLTGSIASGKSTVAQLLVEQGAPLIDADAIVHDLQQPGQPVTRAIADAFGPSVIREDGSLDRAALGQLIFADPSQRRRLEEIVHPAVRSRIWQAVERYRAQGEPAVVLDIPLLFESGWEQSVDEVWVVYVDQERQRARLMARNGLTQEEAERRIRSQMDLESKRNRADLVIDNRGTLEETKLQVIRAWQGAISPKGPVE